MKGTCAVPMANELKTLIAGLDVLARQQFPADGINDLLRASPLSPHTIEPYLFFQASRYTRNLVHKTPDYEILFLCWQPHQASAVHGHEGEKCWMRVEQGSLRFVNYQETLVDGKTQVMRSGELVGQEGFVDGPAIIHSVHNESDLPAVSLHLYARPFAQCDIFDIDVQQRRRVELSYDSIHGQLVSAL